MASSKKLTPKVESTTEKEDKTILDRRSFLAEARSRLRTVVDAESSLRSDMLDDFQFYGADQWPAKIRADREADGKPCLTINRLPQFIRQITNQQRTNRLSIQVNPGRNGTTEIAEVFQGVVRNIENNSDADVAYAMGFEQMVISGRGYWRVLTEYQSEEVGEEGFEQKIVIRPILDPLTVFLDPASKSPDGSDARFAFIIDDIPKDEFRRLHGEASLHNFEMFMTGPDKSPDWMPEGKVRVAEYFYRAYVPTTIAEIEIPEAQEPPQMDPATGQPLPQAPPQMVTSIVDLSTLPKSPTLEELGGRIVRQREAKRPVIRWAKITPAEILEGSDDKTEGRDWPGKYIPIVQCQGDVLIAAGEKDIRGMVRDAKDPQRMYSYWATAMTENIALSPRAPYIGAEGQFEGHEVQWDSANRKNYSRLEYKMTELNGMLAPPPQRNQFDPKIQAIVEAYRNSGEDLKAVMGLYDPSLGAAGPEQSGRAILARQRQGEVGNANYLDNFNRSIRYTGRILIDLIPRIKTPTSIERIVGTDGKSKMIAMHTGVPETEAKQLQQRAGIEAVYDISVGEYDVTPSAGAHYDTRRQEAVQSMLQLLNNFPQMTPAIADLLVKNMDWPGSQEIAQRLRKMVPPGIADDPAGLQGLPPDVQATIQQLQQQNQEMQKELENNNYKVDVDAKMTQAQIASNERIAQEKNRTDIAMGLMKADLEKGMLVLQADLDRITSMLEHTSDLNLHSLDTQEAARERASQAAIAAQPPATPQ
jgi:hypothetical protein